MASLQATMEDCAKYYPSIFPKRASILDHLFFVIGNGYEWKDGELSNCFEPEDPEAEFYASKEHQRKMMNEMRSHSNLSFPEWEPEFPHPRTDEEVARVLADDTPPTLRGSRRPDPTMFYPLTEKYSYCFVVPDDAKLDWLLGIQEILHMCIEFDVPRQVELATKALRRLEKRFPIVLRTSDE